MLIVHGTAAFRDRVPHRTAADTESTTALGSWYAHLVRWRRPLVMFVAERTLLPVLVPLAPAKTLLARLPDAAAAVMAALDVPPEFVAAEVAAMREVRVAPTANRSLVGMLNEDIRLLAFYREADGELDLEEAALRLADVPAGPIDYDSPASATRRLAGLPDRRRSAPRPAPNTSVDAGVPVAVSPPDADRIEIRQQPGVADQLLQELKPLLLADGIDLDDPDEPYDAAELQAAMDRAVERRNLELFTPIGERREAALVFLMIFSATIAEGADALAAAQLAQVEPEARDAKTPEVSAVIGAALDLLDAWLTGRAPGAPDGLAAGVRVPRAWRREARPTTEILALAVRGRAFSSHGALIARHGGEQVLCGCALAVAASAQSWSERTGTPLGRLLPSIVR